MRYIEVLSGGNGMYSWAEMPERKAKPMIKSVIFFIIIWIKLKMKLTIKGKLYSG